MTAFPKSERGGFTIVELMVATVIFIGILGILAVSTTQTATLWRRSAAKVEQFQQARRGFEAMTRRISQATLNTYWDYEYEITADRKIDTSSPPLGYTRQSELRFRSGQMSVITQRGANANDLDLVLPKSILGQPTHGIFFQAPLGSVYDDAEDLKAANQDATRLRSLSNLLNTWGYFIEIGDDKGLRPAFLGETESIVKLRTRSRLMELMEPATRTRIDLPELVPSDNSKVKYNILDPNWDIPWNGWFVEPLRRQAKASSEGLERPVHVLAENVIALVILPRLSQEEERERASRNLPPLCPVYDYDSKRLSNEEAVVKNYKLGTSSKYDDPQVNPKNQLPPVVTVVMVAIDEQSGDRLASIGKEKPDLGLDFKNLFKDATKLEDNQKSSGVSGDGDIAALEKQLVEKRLNYRIFTSNVGIRGAKWSRWQSNKSSK